MTMAFIKEQKWLHFPYVFILKIYPDTEMAELALQHGVRRENILKCEDLAFHELSPTSPFKKSFTKNYQAEFLNEYFLSKERLLHVLPYQAKALTEDEVIQKYDSYLPFDIKSISDLLEIAGIDPAELGTLEFRKEEEFEVPQLNQKLQHHFPPHQPAKDALRVVMLDLSQYFTDGTDMLYDVVEPPLGALYIMSHLKEQLGERINPKILKSRIDFDSFQQLKEQLEEFQPQVIGVRSLTFYRDFFHETVALLRLWGFDVPIIAGGPYATRNTDTLLQDKNIDLLVISEGEATFLELVGKILDNDGRLPDQDTLKTVPGIAFVPKDARGARQLLLNGQLLTAAAQLEAHNPEPVNEPNDPAYIIFTSGSTGTPKGVITEHRNAVNVLEWFGRTYDVNADTRVGQMTNTTFDPSVEQIFGALLRGGSIYLSPAQVNADREAFVKFIHENRINMLNYVPGMLKELLGYDEKLKHLDTVISGGEKLDNPVKQMLMEKGYKLYNHYGPTEITIDALRKECLASEPVTLGKPVDNTRCYIADKYLKPVPVGVVGELLIAGGGVARGYLNRPQLTHERFVTLQMGDNPERLYRTGDLAKLLPNGDICFMGRRDHQVKVRGYRIELGEIESRLRGHSAIRDAVVTARQSEEGGNYLCAYLVPEESDSDQPITTTLLREDLALDLPDYMIPAFFVMLEKLPLNVNGKVDYAALPSPEDGVSQSEYVAPTNDVESVLEDIWSEVLGVDKSKIGIDADFFEIGGDSIKVIQISARLRKHNLKVESGDIFTYPTIRQLSPTIKETKHQIDQEPVVGEVSMTPVQQWFFDSSFKNPNHFNLAIMFFRPEGFVTEAVEAVFKKIQEHHDALRITVTNEGNRFRQHNNGLDHPFSCDTFDFRNKTDALKEMEATAMKIQEGLNLETGTLMKTALFKLDDGDRLLIVIHHLVVDGISWRIIMEDIDTLYNQHLKGEEMQLPLKTDSFRYWAEKLNQYAVGETFLKEKEYWMEIEGRERIEIPCDMEGDNRNGSADGLAFKLEKEETEQLLTKANAAYGTTVNDLLLTALGMAVKKTFKVSQLTVNLEGHGREEILEDIDISRTVGWFTSIYPLVLDLGNHQDTGALLKETKERIRKVPNKGIGYGILKYLTPPELKKDIRFDWAPQIGFNYLGQADAEIGNSSLQMAKESVGLLKGEDEEREHRLEVTGAVMNNQLGISISYSTAQYKRSTIESFVNCYQRELNGIIAFCTGREQKEMTPSDFTYDKLSMETIEEIDSLFD